MQVFEISSLAARLDAELFILLAAFCFVLGIDTIAYDLLYWGYWVYRRLKELAFPPFSKERLFDKTEQRIAIYVACWRENGVINQMLQRACETVDYSNYDIFVGVYPNDLDTVKCVQAVAEKHPRVHAVINPRSGPTTKTQNLNAVFAHMRQVEGDDKYSIIVMHDAEDLIHPLSLKVFNHLIPRKAMVQIPVFPLEVKAHRFVAWTYADEFAEHQLKDMVLREALGIFVPSAGVGCGFDRCALERLSAGSDGLFPSKTLTEDYEIGLRMSLVGLSTVHVQIRDPEQKRVKRYVATRALFPTSFAAATRQKARWITGICLQSWQSFGWAGNLLTLYALYRDRKGLIANPLTIASYVVTLVAVVLNALNTFDPDVVVPTVNHNVPAVWPIIDFVVATTVLRVLQRAYFVASLYGVVQGSLSILRQPVGAIVNAVATARAGSLFFRSMFASNVIRWQKTENHFPTDVAA